MAAVTVGLLSTLMSPTATAITATAMPPTATAEPALPGDSQTALQQLAELNRQAEVLTEKWHYARDQLNARRADLDRARGDATGAAASAERARAVQDQYREQVDRLTSASFQGARLSRLSALLVSDSPQDFLDQMSALDILAVDNKNALDRLTGALAQAQQAERSAHDAAVRAGQAEHDAARLEGELTRSRADMDRQIQVVTKRLAALTRQARAVYLSGGNTRFPINLVGTGVAVQAARVALGKQGSSYVWGGEGPSTFDCSGLVKWSFAQAGLRGLPHSSQEQARMGRSVSQSQLRPGDLIALYSPISHIGLYIGNGLYVNAPQTGDVVKVVPVPWRHVTAMSRIG
ncbi:MAG: NlpC/P60 family protein [Pseudonocardiaceae bacterium]